MSGFSSRSDVWLQIHNITVIRGGRIVLEDLSLELNQGEALLLTGPNGAGKSTLLRCLAGLCPIQGGTIRIKGDLLTDPEQALDLAYLGHQDALKPGLTLRENLYFDAMIGGGSLNRALDSLDLLPLAELPVRLLSAGQKRRGALARVILRRATLWLLDEPSLGLDTTSVTRLGALMEAHRRAGGMIITTTHISLPLEASRSIALAPIGREAVSWF